MMTNDVHLLGQDVGAMCMLTFDLGMYLEQDSEKYEKYQLKCINELLYKLSSVNIG